jgi:hypothetical protein
MIKITKKVAKKPENVNHLFEKTVFASNIDKKSIIQVDPKKFDAKRPNVKLLAKEILYNSIYQASMKIFETPIIVLKIFLLVCALKSTSFSAYFVIESFVSYFSYEVTTTTRTLSETPAPFPKVTICNYYQFTTAESIEFLRMINHISPTLTCSIKLN